MTEAAGTSARVKRRSEHSYRPTSVHAAEELKHRFPPRVVLVRWPATAASRATVLRRLAMPPLACEDAHTRQVQDLGVRAVLDWLAEFPGDS
ncbi:hypothetical protein BJF85_04485 [Saccharomonospora sp. CUA-673]|uniref:hypothetical protein n=1 Tax=Saccharomonospora sp. CUA-673 TaxID=1904969 RepID=UPI000967D2F7|nr:hypothetical protein [Saccharomonospora sp. CUA-673]OLT41686.1 hypothetical protein BJF85_04485 [Saccharomonospora sp. CUA-673]